MYKNQKSARVDVQLFQDWFFKEFVPSVNKFLRKSGLPKKVLLLIDNAPSHPVIKSLQYESIVVKFQP